MMTERSEGQTRAHAELEAAQEAVRLAEVDGDPETRKAAEERITASYCEVRRQFELAMPAHVRAGWERDTKNRWGR